MLGPAQPSTAQDPGRSTVIADNTLHQLVPYLTRRQRRSPHNVKHLSKPPCFACGELLTARARKTSGGDGSLESPGAPGVVSVQTGALQAKASVLQSRNYLYRLKSIGNIVISVEQITLLCGNRPSLGCGNCSVKGLWKLNYCVSQTLLIISH